MKLCLHIFLFGLYLGLSTPLLFACEENETLFKCLHLKDGASKSDIQRAYYKYNAEFDPNNHPQEEHATWHKRSQKLIALYKAYNESFKTTGKATDVVNHMNTCASSAGIASSDCSAASVSSHPISSYARFHAYWQRKKKEADFTKFLNTLVPGSSPGSYKVAWEPHWEKNLWDISSRKMVEITSSEVAHEETIQKVAEKLRAFSFEIEEHKADTDSEGSKGIAKISLPQSETNKQALDILLFVQEIWQKIEVMPIKIEQLRRFYDVETQTSSGPIKKIIIRFKAKEEKDQFLSAIKTNGSADQDIDHGHVSDGTWFIHLKPEQVLVGH